MNALPPHSGPALMVAQVLTVLPDDAGVRLDRWLRRRWPQLPQGRIEKLARSGQIRVDGARVRADKRLAAGERVRIPPLPPPAPRVADEALTPSEIDLAKGLVLFEDADVLVLNKPAGLAVQGGAKTRVHLDRLLAAFGAGAQRPRLTHRLDRDTSGVLILGKSAAAAAKLARAFADRRADKTYWAIVEGRPRPGRGVIDLPLAKTGHADRERMGPVDRADVRGRSAVTEFFTLAHSGDAAAWLALRPRTGRTHQLRAHMLVLGHPIIGDRKYASVASLRASHGLGLQLHARRLVIPHPRAGGIDVEAPPGAALLAGLARFGFRGDSASRDPFTAGE